MRKHFLAGCLLYSISMHAQINKIEHFFAASPKAEALFNLFKNKFQLPVVWDYQTWGNFSSGGLSLGNVAFELVNYKGADKTTFDGVALEPRESVEEFIKVLDNSKILHGVIQPNTYVKPDGSIAGWSNLSLQNLLPDEAGLFICDYKNRQIILENRKTSADTLKLIKGGPLGIDFLQEIVIGSSNFAFHINELAKLPGITRRNDNLYTFTSGPAIRLINSSTNGIAYIVLKIYSLDRAKSFLEAEGLLGKSTKSSIFIDPQATDGLVIELKDN